MNRTEFLTKSDSEINRILHEHGVGYDNLPRQARFRVKQLSEMAQRECCNDVAWDMAMNDRGAAVERAQARANDFATQRRTLLLNSFADLLQRKGVFA